MVVDELIGAALIKPVEVANTQAAEGGCHWHSCATCGRQQHVSSSAVACSRAGLRRDLDHSSLLDAGALRTPFATGSLCSTPAKLRTALPRCSRRLHHRRNCLLLAQSMRGPAYPSCCTRWLCSRGLVRHISCAHRDSREMALIFLLHEVTVPESKVVVICSQWHGSSGRGCCRIRPP